MNRVVQKLEQSNTELVSINYFNNLNALPHQLIYKHALMTSAVCGTVPSKGN